MKKTFYLMFVVVMIITACQNKTKIVPVDTAAAKDSVTKVLEKYHSAYNSKDANTIISLLAPDCLVCGTDSREFFDKPSISNEITKAVADTSFKITYSIDKREIRISADGNTAISVEQCYIKPISQKMPVRMVSHLVKSGNDWLIDFISISFIPNNEDLGKLNKALE